MNRDYEEDAVNTLVNNNDKLIYACIMGDFTRAIEKKYVKDKSEDVTNTVDVTLATNLCSQKGCLAPRTIKNNTVDVLLVNNDDKQINAHGWSFYAEEPNDESYHYNTIEDQMNLDMTEIIQIFMKLLKSILDNLK